MSVAEAVVTDDAPPKKKLLSKKLMIMLAAALVLLAAVGGGVLFWLKQSAPQDAEAVEADGEAAPKPAKHSKARTVPTFVPLDAFTVNLADREAERFAQIGLTLEIEDPKAGEQIKLYMPAIRNGVLMILAHKTSQELLERAGKERLARDIQVEVALAMGIEPEVASASHVIDDDAKPSKKKGDGFTENPVRRVHFSNFIIQ
jgi:flagellar FliL protein